MKGQQLYLAPKDYRLVTSHMMAEFGAVSMPVDTSQSKRAPSKCLDVMVFQKLQIWIEFDFFHDSKDATCMVSYRRNQRWLQYDDNLGDEVQLMLLASGWLVEESREFSHVFLCPRIVPPQNLHELAGTSVVIGIGMGSDRRFISTALGIPAGKLKPNRVKTLRSQILALDAVPVDFIIDSVL